MTELCISQIRSPIMSWSVLGIQLRTGFLHWFSAAAQDSENTTAGWRWRHNTTLAALELELTQYDPARITGYRLTKSCIAEWFHRLSRMTVAEQSTLPGIAPSRSDIIPAGAGICCVLMDLLQAISLLLVMVI